MTVTFDPTRYKDTTRTQWEEAAGAWHAWGPTLEDWLGEATTVMLDAAGVHPGSIVLDVAAGAGGQSLTAASRVGASGQVLATDISPAILRYAADEAARAGLTNLRTRELDGEELDVEPAGFDAVISRLGLIYFPDQERALAGMYRALRPVAGSRRLCTPLPNATPSSRFRCRSFAGGPSCRRPPPANPDRSASVVPA